MTGILIQEKKKIAPFEWAEWGSLALSENKRDVSSPFLDLHSNSLSTALVTMHAWGARDRGTDTDTEMQRKK